MSKHYIQGPDEVAIISADRPVEYGTLDGDTVKVRPNPGHAYVAVDDQFDSNCQVCGGKHRDAIHKVAP